MSIKDPLVSSKVADLLIRHAPSANYDAYSCLEKVSFFCASRGSCWIFSFRDGRPVCVDITPGNDLRGERGERNERLEPSG